MRNRQLLTIFRAPSSSCQFARLMHFKTRRSHFLKQMKTTCADLSHVKIKEVYATGTVAAFQPCIKTVRGYCGAHSLCLSNANFDCVLVEQNSVVLYANLLSETTERQPNLTLVLIPRKYLYIQQTRNSIESFCWWCSSCRSVAFKQSAAFSRGASNYTMFFSAASSWLLDVRFFLSQQFTEICLSSVFFFVTAPLLI